MEPTTATFKQNGVSILTIVLQYCKISSGNSESSALNK